MPLITTRPARICRATRCALEVGPEDGGVETIFRVVGDPDRLILGFIGDYTQHGAGNISSRLDYWVRSGHTIVHSKFSAWSTKRPVAQSLLPRTAREGWMVNVVWLWRTEVWMARPCEPRRSVRVSATMEFGAPRAQDCAASCAGCEVKPRRLTRGRAIARRMCGVLLLCQLTTFGCRSQSSRTIAVIPGTTATEFWEAAHVGAAAAGSETGFRIYWNAPTREDDVERQIALVERAIDSDYVGLVVAPTNYLALVGSVRQALSKRIPTVVIRSSLPIPPGKGLSYILNDDQETGRLAARRVGTVLGGKGAVALLGLDPSGPRSVLRVRAIEEELAKSFPQVSVVEKRSGSSNTAEVQQIAQEILNDGPKLDAIITLGVTATEGTWAALSALGKGRGVKLIGCEQEVDLMAGIRHGDIDSIVVENTYEMGFRAIQTIAARQRGEPVPDKIELKPVLVTKANIDSAEVQRMLSVNWRVSH